MATYAVRSRRIRDPRTIGPDELVERAIRTMETPARRITALVVVEHGRSPVGVLHLHACLDAGFR
jgi:CBS domain-containing protein